MHSRALDTILPGRGHIVLRPGTLVWMAVVVAFFIWSSQQSYLLYHTLVEVVTVGVAFMLGIVTWYTYPFSRNSFLAFLGLAFPAIALIDLLHAFVYKGMNILPVPGANMATQLWIAARWFEAAVLLVAPVFLHRPLRLLPAATGLGAISALLMVLVISGDFPAAYVDGVGLTRFKIVSEYLIVLVLLGATVHLWRRRDAMDPPMFRLMVAAFAATVISELAFTFYVGVYDVSNFVGHLFKLLAFWLIFRAIIARGMEEPFRLLSHEVSTYDAIPQPVVVVDREGKVRQTNRAARDAVGAEAVGADCHAAYHPSELTRDECRLCEWIARGTRVDGVEIHFAQSNRWVSATLTPLRWHGQTRAMVQVMHDVTLRKRGELELRAANRALTTISASNHALVHAHDEAELLSGICETVVRKGGYRFAWVGFVEQDAVRALRPARWSGEGGGYLSRTTLSWGDDASGVSPEGAAVRLRKPVVFNDIASEPDAPWRTAALQAGFAAMLAFPLMAPQREVTGVLVLCSAHAHAFTDTEVTLLSELADDLGYGLEAQRAAQARNQAEHRAVEYHERLSRSLRRTVEALAATIEKRDPYTAGHQRRVADLAAAIGRRLGLPAEDLEGLAMGGLVHDIGKIYVPAEILNRPGPLSPFEMAVVRTHTEVGKEIIQEIEFPWPVAEMVHDHHERLDGSGYPRGLVDGQIGMHARIVGVADVVEAMCSHRPHRGACGVEAALREIREHAGTRFDESVVSACEALFREGYRLPD